MAIPYRNTTINEGVRHMVKIEELPKEWQPAERPWFKIGQGTEAQTEKIRAFAKEEGFETLRGYWRHMESEGWDYYDVIRMSYQ